MTDQIEKLGSLTQIILTGEIPGKLRAACGDLYDLFCEIAEFNDAAQSPDIQDGTILSTGKAISPVNAARCLWDFKRTCEFLRAVSAAVSELQNRFPDEKIEILYAGCGPFAPLIVPLLDKFSPARINLTLLDYHQASITSVKKIFEKLNLEDFRPLFVKADAARYGHPRKLHLVVCETMQNTLANETQTAITLNLAPQLGENGIFLPEKITIELCLTNFGKEFSDRERIELGKIFELDAEKIRKDRIPEFPTLLIEVPVEANKRDLQFLILTKIRIFDVFRLGDYDSSITYPKLLRRDSQIDDPEFIEFSYILDEKPRFEYKIV